MRRKPRDPPRLCPPDPSRLLSTMVPLDTAYSQTRHPTHPDAQSQPLKPPLYKGRIHTQAQTLNHAPRQPREKRTPGASSRGGL
ncbi:hypothetical protein RSOL_504310 [Rhizoctonia solani AG-3 Rhs1AP]|uniref:Uncharacterized protein n=1 Tax=Rhizoctonia solani AG-3 Rhs1AP TaxID=1086054 RepID=X8JSK3_9AGAM|nr:hypothetical protein RSOL_504310 [Rhizoctonia solani AG-3 Rhs1AP]